MSSLGNIKIIKIGKRIVGRQRSFGKSNQNTFEKLYNNYKTRNAKLEQLKERINSERKKNELSQCTFTPKLTKMKNIFNNKNSSKNKNSVNSILKSDSKKNDLIKRQNLWLENKNNKLKKRIVTETMKSMETCVFEPEIKKVNKRTISNLKTEASKIIDKPESYLNYIKKNKQFRKNKSNSKVYEYPITHGKKSPNKLKLLKLNRSNDYDYTKHQLSERSYILQNKTNSNINNNISISSSNKSFNNKEKEIKRVSIQLSKLKNLNPDDLYKMVYLKEKERLNKEVIDNTNENVEKIFEGKEQIYFKKAMEKLHTIIINLNLDDEMNNNFINGNYNHSIQEENNNRKI